MSRLNAVALSQNTTRRNAPAINDAVNKVFLAAALPEGYQFTKQVTTWKPLQQGMPAEAYAVNGEAKLLPLIERVEDDQPERYGSAFDNAIRDSSQTSDVQQRYEEE